MNDSCIVIDGESYLPLEAISECYECEEVWVRDAYEFGLFGEGRDFSGRVVLHVTILDRVAEVVRLSRYQGLGFDAISLLVGDRGVRFVVDFEVTEA